MVTERFQRMFGFACLLTTTSSTLLLLPQFCYPA